VDQYRYLGEQVPLHIARKATDELLASQNWDGEVPDELDMAEPTAAGNDAALADLMSKMGGIRG
jgi:hypothetical protein